MVSFKTKPRDCAAEHYPGIPVAQNTIQGFQSLVRTAVLCPKVLVDSLSPAFLSASLSFSASLFSALSERELGYAAGGRATAAARSMRGAQPHVLQRRSGPAVPGRSGGSTCATGRVRVRAGCCGWVCVCTVPAYEVIYVKFIMLLCKIISNKSFEIQIVFSP